MVTLLIPNHREPQLEETVARLRVLGHPIVVADDPDGRGVGWALRQGLREVQTPWVVFVMADGSEDVGRVGIMAALCTSMDLDAVFGDRWGPQGAVTRYPRGKRWLNRLGNRLVALSVGGSPYQDWTDLAKAYQVDRLRRITWSDDVGCAVEIPVRYLRAAPTDRVVVVPMRWTERTQGRSSYAPWHALRFARAAWAVWREGRRG